MSRVAALALYMLRDLYRSLAGVLPPALTLALYWLTFYYARSVDYFASVGGAALALVSLVTTLLLAERANRAAVYPFLARLQSRAELLAAILAGALCIMAAMTALFAVLAVGMGRVILSPWQALMILPRWLAVFVVVACLGLHMSKLVSRRGSYLLAYTAVGILVTVNEGTFLASHGLGWLVQAGGWLTAPMSALLSTEVVAGPDPLALVAALVYAGILFALAAALFRRKDLLWAE
jgi:hypothetical protein